MSGGLTTEDVGCLVPCVLTWGLPDGFLSRETPGDAPPPFAGMPLPPLVGIPLPLEGVLLPFVGIPVVGLRADVLVLVEGGPGLPPGGAEVGFLAVEVVDLGPVVVGLGTAVVEVRVVEGRLEAAVEDEVLDALPKQHIKQ